MKKFIDVLKKTVKCIGRFLKKIITNLILLIIIIILLIIFTLIDLFCKNSVSSFCEKIALIIKKNKERG